MKTLKKASQKNVLLDKDFYTEDEIKLLMDRGIVWNLDKDNDYKCSFNYDNLNVMNLDLRIDCTNAELKVICKDGYYTNVLIKNDEIYYVLL